jgi:hypothetical protein
MFKRALPAALAAALFAVAQPAAPPIRVRGTTASVEGETMTVATREGPTVAIVLHDPLTVAGTVQGTSGRDLMLSFQGDSTKIVVPPAVPIFTFVSAGRAELKPGVPVMFGATKNADGKLVASRVTVCRDGVAPPM